MTPSIRILVADDEPDMATLAKDILAREGFAVSIARTAEETLEKVREAPPDVLLLDIRFPTIGGLEVCRQLKSDPRTRRVPIIMVSVQGTETDKVMGLEMGADDYVAKPFGRRELVARVRAVLRRSGMATAAGTAGSLKVGEIEVNLDTREVRVGGKAVELRRAEFEILCVFINKPGHVLSRAHLTESVRGYEFPGGSRAMDTHIYTLRKRLGTAGRRIETVPGIGYRFSAD